MSLPRARNRRRTRTVVNFERQDQVPLVLTLKIHHRPRLLDGGGQLGAGVHLKGDNVKDKHQTHVVRQLGDDLAVGLPVLLPRLEEVKVGDLDEGALGHHGQAVDGLLQGVGGHVLGGNGVEVKLLHPTGEHLLPELAQVVVPQVGLLPVEQVQPSRRPRRQVLLQFLISGRIGLSFGGHNPRLLIVMIVRSAHPLPSEG